MKKPTSKAKRPGFLVVMSPVDMAKLDKAAGQSGETRHAWTVRTLLAAADASRAEVTDAATLDAVLAFARRVGLDPARLREGLAKIAK
jgi:hypothetical protein